MPIIISPFCRAARNAAWEEFLFRRRPLQPALLFYRNEAAVLWGRNQNPYLECDVPKCRRQGVSLLRRISGGGTVYHDLGNLNYCFILPRGTCEPGYAVQLLCRCLQELGVPELRVCERHSLWLGERKVSGSAFALSGPAMLLHGCLLLHSDLARLQELLQPVLTDAPGRRGLASVRSPVVNLNAVCPAVSAAAVQEALSDLAVELWPTLADEQETASEPAELLAPYEEKFTCESWTMEMATTINVQRP
ncbi:MAG: lipoate--protein ligase family protein [Lentisphaerae bacterium]|nr:lipoate--protein ligase family protein [Lentisphaerota bacterium]